MGKKIILCAVLLKLRSLCNAQIKKKMLIQNSVPSIPQTGDLSPKPHMQLSQRFHTTSCANGRTNLLGQNTCNYILTSLWKSNIHRKTHRLRKGRNEKHLPSSFGTYILGSLHNESLYRVLLRTHLDLRLPIKSWRPIRANTLKQNTVRINTSTSFLTDSTSEFTMIFRPRKIRSSNMESEKSNAMMFLYDKTQQLQVC